MDFDEIIEKLEEGLVSDALRQYLRLRRQQLKAKDDVINSMRTALSAIAYLDQITNEHNLYAGFHEAIKIATSTLKMHDTDTGGNEHGK